MQVFFVLFDLELKNILWAAESPIPYKTKKRGEREDVRRLLMFILYLQRIYK